MSQLITIDSFTVDTTTDEVIVSAGHNLYTNRTVQFSSTLFLPGGIAASTTYFVTVTSASRFTISLILGGGPQDITTSGSGTMTVFHEISGSTLQALLTYDSPDSIQSLPWFGGASNGSALVGQRALDSPDSIQSLIWFFNGDALKSLLTYQSQDSIQSLAWFNLFARQQLLTFGATDALLLADAVAGGSLGASMSKETTFMDCAVETPLTEGVDYNIDPVNGLIMFLSTGALGGGALEDGNVCGVIVNACCEPED